jgi:hypothetical protein
MLFEQRAGEAEESPLIAAAAPILSPIVGPAQVDAVQHSGDATPHLPNAAAHRAVNEKEFSTPADAVHNPEPIDTAVVAAKDTDQFHEFLSPDDNIYAYMPSLGELSEDKDEGLMVKDSVIGKSPPRKRLRKKPDAMSNKKRTMFLYCYQSSSDGSRCLPVLLVNTAKQRTIVVNEEDSQGVPEFELAKKAEIEAFRRLGCIEDMDSTNLTRDSNVVSTRWVLTIKTREDGTKRYKARLVARGFEDDERLNVTRDSPAASYSAHRLVPKALVERQWTANSWDFETAFCRAI